MKKTLAALIIGAFAASAANAAVVYNNEGTKVDMYGSLRMIMDKSNVTKKDAKGNKTSDKTKSALRNAGSRFGLKIDHELGDGYYALGRLEFRFDDTESRDKFGSLYAKRAYVGFGHKEFGELAFGRQVTIFDDLNQANDYEYGIVPKDEYVPTDGTGVIRYDYRGVEGLQVSANYNFGQRHDAKGADLAKLSTPEAYIKNSYGIGAVYAPEGQGYDLRLAYGHTNYEVAQGVNAGIPANKSHRKDGYLASASYQFGDFKLIGDFGYAYEKEGDAKINKYYVSPGFEYQVVPASKIYGNYLYEHTKTKESGSVDKDKTHGALLGVDYKFHKHVIVFLEGKYLRTKSYEDSTYTGKKDDKAIGVGMRVFW